MSDDYPTLSFKGVKFRFYEDGRLRMKPSIGRLVHYIVSEYDANQINLLNKGNTAKAGDHLPFLIIKVWSEDLVNGQVFLDGPASIWKTSAHQGTEPGTWHEAERV